MQGFQHILVPIDFSEASKHALRRAIHMAREAGGRLTLVHVGLVPGYAGYDLGGYGAPYPETLVTLHEQIATEQKHALEKLAREDYGYAKAGEEVYRVLPPARDPVRVPDAWPFNGLGTSLAR